MKFSIKYIFAIFAMALLLVSCRNSDETVPVDELKGLTKIKEITNDTHVIDLYSATGTTTQGYNDIKLRFKNKS